MKLKAIKTTTLFLSGLLGLGVCHAQAPVGSLLGLTTPYFLTKGQVDAGLTFRAFGGDDKLLYSNLSVGYGLCKDFNLEFLGDFASNGSYTTRFGDADDGLARASSEFDSILFGGSAGEVRVRYKLPTSFAATVQAGLAYSSTPAQEHRLATTVGATAGYRLWDRVQVYAEPKAVILDSNSLVGLGLGASVYLVKGVVLEGEWTPMLSGQNSINTQTLARDQVQLYGVGLHFTQLVPRWSFDLGYTNSTGSTTGFSLTPSLGNVGGLLVGASYRF
jgi:hypothetical protein